MYWREQFPTHVHAVRFATAAARGHVKPTKAQLAGLEYAAREDASGELAGIFSKIGKTLAKLSPSHQLLKAVAPKAMLLSPSQLALSKLAKEKIPKVSSAPKTPPALVAPVETPTTQAQDFSQQMLPMSQTVTGGGGGSPVPADAAAPADNTMLYVGIGAAVLVALVLLMRKR